MARLKKYGNKGHLAKTVILFLCISEQLNEQEGKKHETYRQHQYQKFSLKRSSGIEKSRQPLKEYSDMAETTRDHEKTSWSAATATTKNHCGGNYRNCA
jgi:hypothetical protein